MSKTGFKAYKHKIADKLLILGLLSTFFIIFLISIDGRVVVLHGGSVNRGYIILRKMDTMSRATISFAL